MAAVKYTYLAILTGLFLWTTLYGRAQNNPGFNAAGYQTIGTRDTARAVLLITTCDTCPGRSIIGYVIRERAAYTGDRMPTQPAKNYVDQWVVRGYLDSRRKAFPSTVIVWNYRLK